MVPRVSAGAQTGIQHVKGILYRIIMSSWLLLSVKATCQTNINKTVEMCCKMALEFFSKTFMSQQNKKKCKDSMITLVSEGHLAWVEGHLVSNSLSVGWIWSYSPKILRVEWLKFPTFWVNNKLWTNKVTLRATKYQCFQVAMLHFFLWG